MYNTISCFDFRKSFSPNQPPARMHLPTNATMYREAGARRRVYFNPQTTIYESTVVQCMLVNQCFWSFTMEKVKVTTAAKFSVELLNLSVKTQEKDFYSIYTILVLKHNIHTMYKVSKAHFQME